MKYLILLSALIVISCNSPKYVITNVTSPGQVVADGKLWSSVFQQRAAEYKALCIQAYNIAHLRLDEAIANQTGGKPLAIITDIDETFLDNSPYSVHEAKQGKDWDQDAWYDWTGMGSADTLSGSWSFFTYAASKNVTVFYITNREEKERTGTLNNLLHYHYPFADNQHLIMRQSSSSKEERRQKVMNDYNVVLLLGDNLGDFSALFDKKSEAERNQNVKSMASDFGKKFIVLPNANYGGWEDALYENSRSWTPAQKDSIVRFKAKGF